MSSWQILANDPDDPMKRKMKFDETNGSLSIITEQTNIDEVLRLNTAFLNADRPTSSLWNGGDYVRVAQIPYELIEKWWHEEGINFFRANDEDRSRLMMKLNDGDYSKLRTAPGRL